MRSFAPERTAAPLALAIALAISPTTHATNGYFAIGYGLKSLGMGGVGVALPQDSIAAAHNPAGMAFVGTRFDVAGQLFNPPRRVAAENGEFGFQTPTRVNTGAAPDMAESGSNLFLIPTMGGNYQFNRKITVGLSAIGNGANTRYNNGNFFSLTGDNFTTPSDTLGVQLIQMQMLPTVTYKYKRNQAIGISPIIGIQTFRAYGLGNFAETEFQFTSDQTKLSNNGNDWSFGGGLRVGWLGNFYDNKVSLGAMYSSRVYMSEFDKYTGLFAEKGDFDIPPIIAAGIAFKPNKKLTIAFDAQRVFYSDIASVGNRHPTSSIQDPCTRPIDFPGPCVTPGLTPQPSSAALGASKNSWGFGWTDQTAYKIGASYAVNDRWTVRTGFNYGESPVPDDQLLFAMLAPAITERHATLGVTYNIDQTTEVTFSWVHAFKHSQICAAADGCHTMLTPEGGTGYVAAQMVYDAVGIGFSMGF